MRATGVPEKGLDSERFGGGKRRYDPRSSKSWEGVCRSGETADPWIPIDRRKMAGFGGLDWTGRKKAGGYFGQSYSPPKPTDILILPFMCRALLFRFPVASMTSPWQLKQIVSA